MKKRITNFIKNIKFEYIITLNYLIFGLLWILFSDKILDSFVDDIFLTRFQTYKGFFFIVVTSLFLFAVAKEHMRKRRDAETQLYDSEFRFNKLYENGPFGMVVANKHFQFKKVNPAFCKMMGYTENELLQLTFKDITHPDDLEKDLISLEKLELQEIPIYKTDKRYITKKKKVIWCSLTVTATYSSTGEFIYNLGIIEDITPRKQAEQAIKQAKEKAEATTEELREAQKKLIRSENLLTDIQNINKTGGFDFNIDTQELYWTPGLYQLHDAEPSPEANLVEMSVGCYALDDREKILQAFNQCISDGLGYDLEFPFTTLKGRKLWIRTKTQPILSNGKVTRVIGSVIDITDQKIIEKEILAAKEKTEESERRLQLAVDSGKLGVWDLNPQSNELIFNDKILELYGLNQKHLNRNLNDWIHSLHPDDKEKAIKILQESLYKNKEYNTLFRIVRPDESVKYIKSNAIVIRDAENNPIRMIGINRDITENTINRQKLVEYNEKLEQMVTERTQELTDANLQLNELNATKDKFFSIIAHDLKNPFNSLIGYSDLLLLNAENITQDKVKRYAELMNNSAKDAYNLLGNLLEWSSIQTGKIEPHPVKVKPLELINEIKFLYEPLALAKGIQLDISIKKEHTAIADKEMIKTVLRNLITNAIKFTHKEGIIKIETRKETSYLLVSISDNGCGIEPKHLQKLFNITRSAFRLQVILDCLYFCLIICLSFE